MFNLFCIGIIVPFLWPLGCGSSSTPFPSEADGKERAIQHDYSVGKPNNRRALSAVLAQSSSTSILRSRASCVAVCNT